MAIPGNSSVASKKSRHDKLAAIIRNRLELDEEWFPIMGRPRFFEGMETLRLKEFENEFGQLVRMGCRWEVLLTCLTRCYTYNTSERIRENAQYGSDGEVSHSSVKERNPIDRPPGRDKRNSIESNLRAAVGIIERHEDLLAELGQFSAPPGIMGCQLSSDEALVYLPKLLRWCQKVLSDDSLGNFRTVESVGQLVPCVYVDVVSPKKDSSNRRLPLSPVAKMLRAIFGERRYKQDQLREALSRFQRQYASVYQQLRAKIEDLHHASNESPDGWRQIFASEARRRSR
jgi:hypothetical protein